MAQIVIAIDDVERFRAAGYVITPNTRSTAIATAPASGVREFVHEPVQVGGRRGGTTDASVLKRPAQPVGQQTFYQPPIQTQPAVQVSQLTQPDIRVQPQPKEMGVQPQVPGMFYASGQPIQPPTVALGPGSANTTAVKQLQDYLVSQGYMMAQQVATGPGVYGPQTTAAVLAMQKALGVDYSSGPGYFGPRTLKASSQQMGVPFTPTTYTPPVVTNVPPSAVPAPILPQPTATPTLDAYYASMASQVDAARKALEDTYNKQITDLQAQQTAAQKRIDEFTAKQETIIGQGGKIEELTAPFRADLEKAERERLYINKNFEDNQKLTNELDSLLTDGNTLVQQMKGVTGLASIRDPRVNKTISDISARAGVIQAVMSARSGQIAEAYRMIDRSVSAVTADRQDQLSYYTTLYNFYEGQKDTEGEKLITLTADEKTYLNAQIGLLQDDLKTAQTNAENLKNAISDPDKALAYASAGVTLNDTLPEINKKLAQYAYSKEISDTSNKMALDGASYLAPGQTAPTGSQILTTTDSQGVTKQWYVPVKATTATYTERLDSAISEAIPMASEELEKSIGTDGYVDPSVYLRLRVDFSALTGGDISTFDNNFALRLSPQERARLGVGKATGQKAVPEGEEVPSWLNE